MQETEFDLDQGHRPAIHEKWERRPELHCIFCGAQSIWAESTEGDFYVGNGHVCTACGRDFTWQGFKVPPSGSVPWQRIEKLRAAELGARSS